MSYCHFIGGRLVGSPLSIAVVDPATGEPFAQCPSAGAEQMDEAVGAAAQAFPAWSALPLDRRRECLEAFAGRLETMAEELAPLLTREQGKPLARAREEFTRSAALIRGIVALELPAVGAVGANGEHAEIRHEPLGVVGAITPWNVPIVLAVSKIAQALVTGNTIVVKPSPYAPLTTLRMGEPAPGLP